MTNHFESIDNADLVSVNGGSKGKAIVQGIKTGAKYVGKAASWGWNEVVKPGLIWAGAESLAEKATGGGQQQPQAPAQQP